MIKARIWQDEQLEAFVTGTQDVEKGREAATAALTTMLASGDVYDVRVDTMGLDAGALARAMLAGVTPILEAGRIIPDEEYGWLWYPGLKLDRPGAFFALRYEMSSRVEVEGFTCHHEFTDGYPGAHARRCIWCMEPDAALVPASTTGSTKP